MAKKNLGSAASVDSMIRSNSIVVEIGGSVRRITLEKFMEAIQTGALQLRQYAFGVPLKQNASSPAWGRVGNLDMWNEFREQLGDYLLTNDGKMAKLSKTSRAYYADGTAVDETKGHIVFSGPRLYYLVKNDTITGVPYLWGSDLPIGGDYIERPIIGAMKGYALNGKLVSRSNYSPTVNKTITDFNTLAKANGSKFGLTCYDHRRYLMMINLFEFGNPNVQVNVGNGICGDTQVSELYVTANQLKTGATNALGDACGKIDIEIANSSGVQASNSCRVNFFGIEDLWGWDWEMTQGLYFGNSANAQQDGSEVFIYEGNRLPTTAELQTHPNGDYRQLTRLTTGLGVFVREMLLGDKFDLIPKRLDGGSNSYWCDGWWGNATGQLLLWGGTTSDGANCGLACVRSDNAFSSAYAFFGARLAYYGEPQIVNGAEI